MDCKQFRESIDDFETLSAELDVHVRTCVDCARWLREMRMIEETIAVTLRESPAPAFASRVRSRIRARQRGARAVFGLSWTEAVAACLTLCAMSFAAYHFDLVGFVSATVESLSGLLPDITRWSASSPAVPAVRVDLSWLNASAWGGTAMQGWLAFATLVGAVALHEAINRRSYVESRPSKSGRNWR